MRLVRLVAAGLVLGALAGFLGALLRPRSLHRPPAPHDAGVPVAGAAPPVDLTALTYGPAMVDLQAATRLDAARGRAVRVAR
jgi:hypothetical protein